MLKCWMCNRIRHGNELIREVKANKAIRDLLGTSLVCVQQYQVFVSESIVQDKKKGCRWDAEEARLGFGLRAGSSLLSRHFPFWNMRACVWACPRELACTTTVMLLKMNMVHNSRIMGCTHFVTTYEHVWHILCAVPGCLRTVRTSPVFSCTRCSHCTTTALYLSSSRWTAVEM